MTRNPTRGRWGIAAAAVLVQLALGAVYAWSVFNKPLQAEFGWSKAQAVLPFEVAIGTIFIGSLVGGRIQDRTGPRPVALAGGLLYALGILGASLARSADQLWLLVLTYGVMGGVGLGAAHHPDRDARQVVPGQARAVTGIAVGGFGFGAVLTAPIAKALLGGADVPTRVFLPLGLGYLVMVLLGASQFRNPPAGYAVPGWVPRTGARNVAISRAFTLGEALRTRQWWQLTGSSP